MKMIGSVHFDLRPGLHEVILPSGIEILEVAVQRNLWQLFYLADQGVTEVHTYRFDVCIDRTPDHYFFTNYTGKLDLAQGPWFVFEVIKPANNKTHQSRLGPVASDLPSGGNAPSCDVCGSITVCSGPHEARVYKCMNCGNTMGAS